MRVYKLIYPTLLRLFGGALLFLLAFQAGGASGAVIQKVKGRKALIRLDGESARKGSYFEVLNVYGEPRGLLKITKAGRKKALGQLVAGKMRKRWLLEPKSSKWAKRKRARLRKIAQAKKSRRRMRRRQRRLASERQDAYISPSYEDDLPSGGGGNESGAYGEDEIFSGRAAGKARENSRFRKRFDEEEREGRNIQISAGLLGAGGWNSMLLGRDSIKVPISGLGFEAGPVVAAAFQNGFSAEGFLGYKSLSMSNEGSLDCNSRDPCALSIEYIKFGGDLRYSFYRTGGWELQGGLSGALLWIFREPYNNAGLDPETSFGMHGSLGLTGGAIYQKGRMRFPMFVTASLFNPPPTQTISSWSIFLKMGMAYTF